MNKNPTAYILVGIPASGKTTWALNQNWIKDCVYISTDKLVEKYAKEQEKTYSDVFESFMPTAVELMTKEVILAREQQKDIIWDQTSTTILSRKRKFNMLPNYYHIAIVFKTPKKEELENRLNSRHGKHIPYKIIEQMIQNFEQPMIEEGYREIWYAV